MWIESEKAIDIFAFLLFEWRYREYIKNKNIVKSDLKKIEQRFLELKGDFEKKYKSYDALIDELFSVFITSEGISNKISKLGIIDSSTLKHHMLIDYFQNVFANKEGSLKEISAIAMFDFCISLKKKSENAPVKVGKYFWFKGFVYSVTGNYSEDQIRLLILEEFDKERRYFENLKVKFDSDQIDEARYERSRIPENVRVEVWRRDGGKCARCGSRERLEYDHIVPVSKGGSNTARNIELLCEKCNRSKSNNVV